MEIRWLYIFINILKNLITPTEHQHFTGDLNLEFVFFLFSLNFGLNNFLYILYLPDS